MTTLRFLGTGAAGATPGEGRSRRRESSAAVSDGDVILLIDVTRHADGQLSVLAALPDVVLLTHGHADAIGGLATLDRRLRSAGTHIPVLGLAATLDAVERRFRHLEGCELQAVESGTSRRFGGWTVTPRTVPHAADPERFPTVAWRITRAGAGIVYASDLARPVADLARFARGARLLVIDGATYGRRIPTHLRIDQDLTTVCRWKVERILLTQIGRSAPPHPELEAATRRLCPRAGPAHDGLVVDLSS